MRNAGRTTAGTARLPGDRRVRDLYTTNEHAHLSAAQIVAHIIWENNSLSGNAVTPRPLADVLATEFA